MFEEYFRSLGNVILKLYFNVWGIEQVWIEHTLTFVWISIY